MKAERPVRRSNLFTGRKMGLFRRVAIDMIEVDMIKTPMKTWREAGRPASFGEARGRVRE